ncbi:hypothetical protein Misp06_00351 [Microbulbifer sp. NBRC 101763]
MMENTVSIKVVFSHLLNIDTLDNIRINELLVKEPHYIIDPQNTLILLVSSRQLYKDQHCVCKLAVSVRNLIRKRHLDYAHVN